MNSELKIQYPVPEAAQLMSMGTRTMWDLIKKGTIKTHRIGRRVYITRAELERFARRTA